MESSMFFCAQCGEVMKPFINDPDLMVCEPCGTFESIDATTPPEGYDPKRYKDMVEFAEKLSPETVAMLLMDGNDALAEYRQAIERFLKAWEAKTEPEEDLIYIRVPADTGEDDRGLQWQGYCHEETGERGKALWGLWDAVNQQAED